MKFSFRHDDRRGVAFGGLNAFPPLDDYPEAMRAGIELARRSVRRRRIISRSIAVVYYGCVASLVCVSAWIIAMATDRAIPTLTTVEITTPIVAPGADLNMKVVPHRLRTCEGKVVFRAFDGPGNIVNESETEWGFPVGPVGFDRTFNRKIRISHDAVASRVLDDGTLVKDARMRIERKFFCNPIQKILQWPIVEVTPDMPFYITKDVR